MAPDQKQNTVGARLLNRRQLRAKVPVSDMSIWRWRKAGIFPEPIKINGRCYWREDGVDRFMEDAR